MEITEFLGIKLILANGYLTYLGGDCIDYATDELESAYQLLKSE